MERWEKLVEAYLNLDRRIIYLLVALAVLIPLLVPLNLPVKPREEVKAIFDTIEQLPPGSTILIANDYDPASEPELYPMTVALLKHAFLRKHKVILITLWLTGPGLVVKALEQVKEELKPKGIELKEGEDYAFLGFKPGGFAVILQMGGNMYALETDYAGNRLEDLPIFKNVRSLRDIDYQVVLAAGNTIDTWIIYGSERYSYLIGGGVTGVIAPNIYPYYKARQLNGILGGLRGASEYERLLAKRYDLPLGRASKGMDAQTMVHLLIVFGVILANLAFFVQRSIERGKA